MDLIILSGGFSVGPLVEGYESLQWTERFQAPGDFTLRTKVLDHLDQLPENALVSLLDTREVMKVESHTIDKNDAGETELVVTGRTLDAFLEKRVIYGLRGVAWSFTKVKAYEDMTAAGAAEAYVWDAVIDETLAISNPVISRIPTIPQADKISGSVLTDSVETSLTAKEWFAEAGPVLPRLQEILKEGNLGIRCIRGPSTGKKVTFHPVTGRTVAAEAEHEGLRFDIYSEDTAIVNYRVFDYSAGHMVDAGYLNSNQKYRNVAYVLSSTTAFDDTFVYSDGASSAAPISFGRHVMLVDPGFNEDAVPEGEGTYQDALISRGRTALVEQRKDAVFTVQVGPNTPYVYNQDYKLGDIVIARGEFGVKETMRVMEFIRNENSDGETGYPGLVRKED